MTIEEYAAFLALRENCLRDVAQLKRDIERRFDAIDPGAAVVINIPDADVLHVKKERDRATGRVAKMLQLLEPSRFGSFSASTDFDKCCDDEPARPDISGNTFTRASTNAIPLRRHDDEPARTEQHRFYIEDEK